ncbi:MAG: hypothetical protein K2Z81_26875, partial [Cyanobacteria bacterium]|nr:hypothetical protein [Cyanobacteriota bacterium]
GWIFFVVKDLHVALAVIKRLVIFRPVFSHAEQSHQFLVLRPELPVVVAVAAALTLILIVINLPLSWAREKNIFSKMPAILKAAYCCILILLMVTFLPDSAEPFIYFQF